METYGQMVARIRTEQGLSQTELAAKSGAPKRTLQDIEGDKVERPQRRNRERIEAALGIARPEDTRNEWPLDVRVFLDIMGAFLANLPEDKREALIHEETRRMFTWMR